MITGFRVARGGAQELAGVLPDLTIMGKVIGGGLPAAAYGGPARADGAHRARGRRLPGGHAVGQPARGRRRPGDARALDEAAYARLAATTEELAAALREAAGDHVAVQVATAPGLLTVFFSERPRDRLRGRGGLRPRGPRAVVPGAARARRVRPALALRGVVPSLAHDSGHIARTAEAAAAAFAELAG